MLTRHSALKGFWVILLLLLAANFAVAQDETAETAEKLMIWQLEAVKEADYQRFIEHGNKAFKEFMDEYLFDTFKLQRGEKIAKGYILEYLGTIR